MHDIRMERETLKNFQDGMGAKLATAVKEALEAILPRMRQSHFSGSADGEVLYVSSHQRYVSLW